MTALSMSVTCPFSLKSLMPILILIPMTGGSMQCAAVSIHLLDTLPPELNCLNCGNFLLRTVARIHRQSNSLVSKCKRNLQGSLSIFSLLFHRLRIRYYSIVVLISENASIVKYLVAHFCTCTELTACAVSFIEMKYAMEHEFICPNTLVLSSFPFKRS